MQKRLINTRPKGQEEHLSALLQARGAAVVHLPMLRVAPIPLSESLRARLVADEDSVLVVTSANGVHALAPFVTLANQSVVALGEKTAAALTLYGAEARSVSPQPNSEGLAAHLVSELPSSVPLVLCRGTNATDDLPTALSEKGFAVETYPVYQVERVMLEGDQKETLCALLDEHAGVILTSPEAVRAFDANVQRLAEAIQGSARQCAIYALAEKTARAASDLGYRSVSVAQSPSDESLASLVWDL